MTRKINSPSIGARRVELLAPAGNMDCLKTALYFGADAVYVAGKRFGLRAFANNFTVDELRQAATLVHAQKKRIYVTVNALFSNADFEGLSAYLRDLKAAGVDAVIVSDPGVLCEALAAGLEVHLSTQLSTYNAKSAQFWLDHGVSRIVLAREMTLGEMADTAALLPPDAELEAFVHGAMCIAYSGRCLISSVMTGRSANKGACAQPCRWNYEINEVGDERSFPIMEDNHGTYLMNSKDLCMIEHVGELIEAGVASFKIEGRMKSIYYVGSVLNAYRRAIDAYYAKGEQQADPRLMQELVDSSSRHFTTGFYYGDPGSEGQDAQRAPLPRGTMFCGLVLGHTTDGRVAVEQRNKFRVGDTLSVLSPHHDFVEFCVKSIEDEDGTAQECAPHPQQHVTINCPFDLQKGDLLRLKLN